MQYPNRDIESCQTVCYWVYQMGHPNDETETRFSKATIGVGFAKMIWRVFIWQKFSMFSPPPKSYVFLTISKHKNHLCIKFDIHSRDLSLSSSRRPLWPIPNQELHPLLNHSSGLIWRTYKNFYSVPRNYCPVLKKIFCQM